MTKDQEHQSVAIEAMEERPSAFIRPSTAKKLNAIIAAGWEVNMACDKVEAPNGMRWTVSFTKFIGGDYQNQPAGRHDLKLDTAIIIAINTACPEIKQLASRI